MTKLQLKSEVIDRNCHIVTCQKDLLSTPVSGFSNMNNTAALFVVKRAPGST